MIAVKNRNRKRYDNSVGCQFDSYQPRQIKHSPIRQSYVRVLCKTGLCTAGSYLEFLVWFSKAPVQTISSLLDLRFSWTVRHSVPLKRLTCLFPWGLYGVVRLHDVPREDKNCLSSSDKKHTQYPCQSGFTLK